MPEWLLKEENYIPPSDSDAFIDRSILGFLRMLSALRTQGKRSKAKTGVRATVLVPGVFVLATLVSASNRLFFIALVFTGLLVWLSMMDGFSIRRILKAVFGATLFTGAVMLPTLFMGHGASLYRITEKVAVTTLAVSLLAQSLRWDAITGALRRFFVPDLFILVLDITLKYLVLLGELALNMLYALRLRSVGRNSNKRHSLSGIAGMLFLHSREMAGEMYAAMECRGFTGDYRMVRKQPWTWVDRIAVIVLIGLILLFAALGR